MAITAEQTSPFFNLFPAGATDTPEFRAGIRKEAVRTAGPKPNVSLTNLSVNRLAGITEGATRNLQAFDPLLRGVPTEIQTSKEGLRRRLLGSGLSEAATEAAVARFGTQTELRKFQQAQPLLASLEALRNRLERTASGLDAPSSSEAFLTGFFG